MTDTRFVCSAKRGGGREENEDRQAGKELEMKQAVRG